jgi:tetratricopeptide (TPR) repeat protein
MKRPGGMLLATVLVLAVASGFGEARGQDRTSEWLEARGLNELLSVHLENQLTAATGDAPSRGRLAARLAEVYAELLRVEPDEGRRLEFVERSKDLLKVVSGEDAASLRIALARNRYLNASRLVENGRIQIASDEELAGAIRELARLADELERVRRDLKSRISNLLRSKSRRAEQRLDTTLRWESTAALLEGWSRYYVGRAEGSTAELERAQLALGSVLQGEDPIPDPDDVSVDLQVMEGFSRAILGMGLTTSALVSTQAGDLWLRRLEYPETDAATRKALPGWRLAAELDAGDYRRALDRLERLSDRAGREGDEALPVVWLRLAAVGGLRGMEDGDQTARVLAGTALAELAGRGELAQVRDLADRFGTEALGREGFAFRYVRGIEAYRVATEARQAGDAGTASASFERAVVELQAAIEQPDAAAFAAARAGCEALIGWSLLELGRAAEAADAFESAAASSSGDRRADALWGAIVALDRIVESGGSDASGAASRRDDLSSRFVDAFPADDRAPSLLVRRIAVEENPGADDLEVLLGVPSTHPTWELARRRAAQALYRAYRSARSGERTEPGARMLVVADELLGRSREDGIFMADLRGVDGMLLRQAAEVSTDPEVHDAVRAARYLAQIETAAERGGFDGLPDILNEVAYRRVGLALGAGDFEEAGKRMLALPMVSGTPEADRWSRLAAQRVHRSAVDRMRSGRIEVQIARAAVDGGERYLELQMASSEEDPAVEGGEGDRFLVLDRDRMLPFAASVAAARDALFRAAGDPDDAVEALAWYRAILDRRPLDGSVLEASGDLAMVTGDDEFALDCWRRLVRGAVSGSETWWKARARQISVLLKSDPVRAGEVLAQVRVLYPDLGSDPWKSELRDLDVKIDIAIEESKASEPDRDPEDGERDSGTDGEVSREQ